mgnify:CR=1 FL=1
MTQLQKKIEALAQQQQKIGYIIDEQTKVINNQAAMLKQHQNAIENMMSWLGEEMGEEAVDRLKLRLGVPPETGSNSIVTG